MLYTEMLAAFGKSHFLESTQEESCFGKARHADGTNHKQRLLTPNHIVFGLK